MMAISATVKQHLAKTGIRYDLLPHDHTGSSITTAISAQISVKHMVKAVILKDGKGYLMAVMPATSKVSESELYDVFGRRLHLAHEDELAPIFTDCDPGAIPPLAEAYDIEAVWDDSLASLEDVYFEGGDHDTVVHIKGEDFRYLMSNLQHADLSQQPQIWVKD